MIVTCVARSMATVPEAFVDDNRGYGRSAEFPLTVGAEYLVYAITSFTGGFWFYVLDDDYLHWPIWYPSAVFDVSDSSLPNDWVVGQHLVNGGRVRTVLSYPAWANDPFYYEHLVDEESEAVEEFRSRVPGSSRRWPV